MKSKARRNHLAAWRLHREMTQEALADAVNTTKATISRLESGSRGLSQKWLERLSPILDCKPADLLDAPNAVRVSSAIRTVPLINTVQAGHWTQIKDGTPKGEEHPQVPVARRIGPRAFALEIDGPSMLPDFRPRDVVIVDPDVAAQPGDFIVAQVDQDDEATFKRLRVKGQDTKGRAIVELVPLNPDWPTLTMKRGGQIVGVAVDLIRRLR